MKRKIVCFCEHSFEADFPDSVDLEADPSVEQQILDGELLAVRCPECGKVLKPEFPVLVRDPEASRRIYMIPELDRSAFLRGTLSDSVPEIIADVLTNAMVALPFTIPLPFLSDTETRV